MASSTGDSPGASGAPPAVDFSPTVARTVDNAVDAVVGSAGGGGAVDASTGSNCVTVVVLTTGSACTGDVVAVTALVVADCVLTTVCAATRMPESAGARLTFESADADVRGEPARDVGVVAVTLLCDLLSFTSVGGLDVGVGLAVGVGALAPAVGAVVPVVSPVVPVELDGDEEDEDDEVPEAVEPAPESSG